MNLSFILCLAALVLSCNGKILMVQTLTRHGTRAPDKIVGETICKPVLDPNEGIHHAFVDAFGVGAAELTGVGVRQMRDVGFMLRERYHGFLDADYGPHTKDWEFMAKSGTRQQRSMMGIVLGIFPNDVVPIDVPDKKIDAILGGPAAACAGITHDYIVKWHETKGREMVKKAYSKVVVPLERACNVSLINDPVNALPEGANPHAYIGDISDLMDSLKEARYGALLPISEEEHAELTQLAFNLEQGAHFDFPGGAAMHAGAFPDHLLSAFEAIAKDPEHKLPKGVPKFKLHACSRELHYGLAQLLDWMPQIQLEGQPRGRIKAGTTFLWELHSDLTIHSYYYAFPMRTPEMLQFPMTIPEFRAKYEAAVKKCGDWNQICVKKENLCLPQKESKETGLTEEVERTPLLSPIVDHLNQSLVSNNTNTAAGESPSVLTIGNNWTWVVFFLIVLIVLGFIWNRRSQGDGYRML